MNKHNKQQIKSILNSNLLIHWWNFDTKSLDFKGTVKEYLDSQKVKYTVKANINNGFETLTFKVKFSVGSLKDISFTTGSFEDLVRMVINVKLTYLGDRARYSFLGRTRNFTH